MIRFDKLTLKGQEALQAAQSHAQERVLLRPKVRHDVAAGLLLHELREGLADLGGTLGRTPCRRALNLVVLDHKQRPIGLWSRLTGWQRQRK